MKKNLLKFALLIIIMISTISIVHAAGIDPNLKPINQPDLGTAGNNSGATAVTLLILQILTGGLLYFAAPIAIIMIALNGFQIVTGGAESEKLEQGKKNLTWSIIGLLIIILSWSIVRIAIKFLIQTARGDL